MRALKAFQIRPTIKLSCLDRDEQFFNHELFSGIPIGDDWKKVELLNPGTKPSRPLDFYGFGEKALVCSEKVRLWCGPFEDEGEFLAVKIKGLRGKYYMYNVTHVTSHLDPKKTIWHKTVPRGQPGCIKSPAFHADRLGEDCVFKIPEDGATAIYCLERNDLPEHEGLKALVEEHGLTGLKFKPVWSSDK
jgi:hypothetical protein